MDEIARYNLERWQALVGANAVFTRPWLDLDASSARARIDPEGRLGEIAGKRVLCLAGGGGQQSIAFALLGGAVTVLDLSGAQLERDREVAAHYGVTIEAVQGDMRDLSAFEADSFDVVWHPYSLNFVPDAREVFRGVARVMRAGGIYHFNCANPFVMGVQAGDWDGAGYPLRIPYVDGVDITSEDEEWVYRGHRPREPIGGPREYRHTLGTLVNGLIEQGFALLHLSEQHLGTPNFAGEPGSHEHWTAIAPPWLAFWAAYRPGAYL
jgi:SAM-dependent methyltransferase